MISADIGPLLKTLYDEHRYLECTHLKQQGSSLWVAQQQVKHSGRKQLQTILTIDNIFFFMNKAKLNDEIKISNIFSNDRNNID